MLWDRKPWLSLARLCRRMAYSPNSLIDQRRWRPFPVTSAVAAAGPPPPGNPLPHVHMSTARSAWWRGSQQHHLSLGALSLTAERHSSSSSTDASDAADGSPSGNDSGTSAGSSSSQHPLLASPAYQAALRASLSRTSLTAEQVLQAAAAQSSASPKARMLDSYSDMQRLLAAAMAALAGPALSEMLEGWAAAADERPPGFDSQAVLALPGLAGELRCACVVVGAPVRASRQGQLPACRYRCSSL